MAATSSSRVGYYYTKPTYASGALTVFKTQLEQHLRRTHHDIDSARIDLHLKKPRARQQKDRALNIYAEIMATGTADEERHVDPLVHLRCWHGFKSKGTAT